MRRSASIGGTMIGRAVRRMASALVFACGVAASSFAQIGLPALDSSTWPLSTPILADAIEFAGLRVPPEVVWRCHGEYLKRIHVLEEDARAVLEGFGLDGVRYERPEVLRKGISALRRAMARRDEALTELMRCLAESVPEDERARINQLGAELRARAAVAQGVTLAPPHDLGGGLYVFDITAYLDEIAITADERDVVHAAVLASSSSRERTGRALMESGLANRMRIAELAVEYGVAGMSSDAASPILKAIGLRRRAEFEAAHERGENPALPVDPYSQMLFLRSCSREAACDALTVQRDVVEAVAALVSPEMGKRLRRAFRHRNLGLDSIIDSQRWEMSQPKTPSIMWTARRVLAQPEVRDEKRKEAVKILAEWADVEDAVKERMARERLGQLCEPATTPNQRLHRGPGIFYPGMPAIAELVDAAQPFQERLARVLDMPWVADASLTPPGVPAPEALPAFGRAEIALTGALHGAAMPASLRVLELRKRGLLGWRPADAEDFEEWMKILGESDSTREIVETIIEAHRAEWDERVAPLMSAAQEPRPRGERVAVTGGFTSTEPVGLPEWRERVRRATESSLQAATEVEAALIADLRAAAGPERAWCVDAIAFSRRADQVHSIERFRVNWVSVAWVDDSLFGTRRVEPIVAILRAGLPPEETRLAIREAVSELPPLAALLEEELQVLARLSLISVTGEYPKTQEAVVDLELESVNRIMRLEASWRTLERAALEAAMETLAPAERARLELSIRRVRFTQALDAIHTAERVGDELRRAAAEDRDVERGLRAIETIDAAEIALAECIERRAAPTIEKLPRPLPVKFDSVDAMRAARSERTDGARALRAVSREESARFAWYLANALPPEVIWRSPAFLRMAGLHHVTPPQRAGDGGAPQ